jgi:NRAMP (natural resistance-associated macrophage protein)-like metal ion transporter
MLPIDGEPFMPGKLTLREASKQFGIPVRKLAFLIRTGLIDAELAGETLFISDSELRRYADQPHEVVLKHHVSYLKTLGPGLITGASDDDPSGIGTYSAVGSTYGLGLSWLAVYLLPMMIAVQETVARIGIVTQSGLAHVIGRRYGKRLLYPLVGLLLVANTVNIGADIGAMVASLQLLVPINFIAGVAGLTIAITAIEILVPYHRYSRILKWLTASLAAYIITGFIIKPDWWAVLRSLAIPRIQFNAGFLAAMVAVMGTTITPYLFFWQASEEVEQERDEDELGDFRTPALTHEIREMRKDTYTGMALANVVFLFIIVTTAFVLHDNGITNVDSAQKAAMALKPLAGDLAALLFTVGIFGVGLLAVPVLAGASAYAVAELFKWHEGLSKRFGAARGFYWVIIASMLAGMLLNLVGINPIKALYYAAIVNGTIAPILMFFIFRIGRDEKVMGRFTSPGWVNVWGWVVTVLMGGSAIALFVFAALGK